MGLAIGFCHEADGAGGGGQPGAGGYAGGGVEFVADVLVAYDGQDGFEMLGRADALCTDLDLPRMNGETLIVNFRRLKPGAPVIAMSAGPGENAGADRFFPKPYSTAAVRETLKEMLYA